MRVKDWHSFQHYKHRDPPWIKLHKTLLDDPDWSELDPASAKALVMIWLIASESDGELPDERKLAFRLRMTREAVHQLLHELSHWIEGDASSPLAPRLHVAAPETELSKVKTEEKEGGASAPAPRLRDKKRAVSLPKEFAPHWQSAFDVGLSRTEAEREFLKFKNHAAQGARTCVDWQAAWRNWCLKAAEFLKKPMPQPEGAKMATLTVASPGWNLWKSHYRDTGQQAMAAQMDRFANEDRAMTFPTQTPGGA